MVDAEPRRVVARGRDQDRQSADCNECHTRWRQLKIRSSSSTRPDRPANPKGVRAHLTGGYITYADATPTAGCSISVSDDIYACVADIGWITGHTYIVYGPSGQRGDHA